MDNLNNHQGGLSWTTPSQTTPTPLKGSGPTPKEVPLTPPPGSTQGGQSFATYAALLVCGVIVGVLIAWGWNTFKNRPSAPTVNQATQGNSATLPTNSGTVGASSGAAISIVAPTQSLLMVPTPQKAGLHVAIEKADVTKPTWVVVYESRDGRPGNALGAALFFTGNKGGTVTLLRATRAGQTYFVGESVDNGDKRFSLTADSAVRAADGAVLWAQFIAQ